MPTVVETLEIQFKANTGNVESATKKVKKSVKEVENPTVKMKADTKDATKKIDGVKKQVKQTQKKSTVHVAGDTRDAMTKLQQVDKATKSLKTDVKINVDTKEANSAIGGLGDKISGLMGTLKAAGLVMMAKKGFDFTMNLVNVASNAEQSISKLEGTLGTQAMGYLQNYVGGLNEKYGFNETAIYDMASQFVTLFKAYGYEEQKATDAAMRLINQSVDYASFFNMTPAEVAGYFMSMLKGSYEVGDSIGMPLNATRLDAFAAERGISGSDDAATRAMAFVEYTEQNAQTVGLAGDWERTKDQYANITTVLGEQWQTLKENAGTLLLPAATTAADALSTLLGAVIGWTDEMQKSGYERAFEDAMGSIDLTDEQIAEYINGVTGPVDQVTSAMQTSSANLDNAMSLMGASLNNFATFMRTSYMNGDDWSDMTIAGENVNDIRDRAISTVETGRATLLDQFLAFTAYADPMWDTAKNEAVTMINDYYDAMVEAVTAKADELARAVSSSFEDGELTATELENIIALAKETAAASMTYAAADVSAAQEMYIEDQLRNGDLSAYSIEELYMGMQSATAESRAALDAEYANLKKTVYAVALAQGQDPQAAWAAAESSYQAMYQELDRQSAERLSRLMYSAMETELGSIANGGYLDAFDLKVNNLDPLLERYSYLMDLIDPYLQNGTATAEMKYIADMYKGLSAIVDPNAELTEDFQMDMFGWFTDWLAGFTGVGAYYGETEAAGSDSGDTVKAISETNGLLRQLIQKETNITLNGYKVGKAISTSTETYHYVKGV